MAMTVNLLNVCLMIVVPWKAKMLANYIINFFNLIGKRTCVYWYRSKNSSTLLREIILSSKPSKSFNLINLGAVAIGCLQSDMLTAARFRQFALILEIAFDWHPCNHVFVILLPMRSCMSIAWFCHLILIYNTYHKCKIFCLILFSRPPCVMFR